MDGSNGQTPEELDAAGGAADSQPPGETPAASATASEAAPNEPGSTTEQANSAAATRRGRDRPVWPASAELALPDTASEAMADSPAPSGQRLDSEAWRSFTLDSAMQFALAHHPLLRARSREVAIARAKLVGAGLLPNPELVMDIEGPVQHADPTDMTTRLVFTVPTGGKIGHRMAVAREGITRAQCAVSRQTEAVLLEAADAAVEALYLQELVSLYSRLGELAAKVAETQKGRFEAHVSTLANKIEAEVDAADIELRRCEAAIQLQAARQRLARAIALVAPAVPRMEGRLPFTPLPDVPVETLLATARATRPELAEARATIRESQQAHALAYAEAHPDLRWGPRYQDRLGEDRDALGARIDFDIPVFDRNQGNICASAAQVQTNRELLAASELTTLNDVAAAYTELAAVESSLQYYATEALPLTDRTEAMLRENIEQPVIDPNQASNILRNVVRMRVHELELRYRYVQLQTRLEVFLGRRLADLASEPFETPPSEPSEPQPAKEEPRQNAPSADDSKKGPKVDQRASATGSASASSEARSGNDSLGATAGLSGSAENTSGPAHRATPQSRWTGLLESDQHPPAEQTAAKQQAAQPQAVQQKANQQKPAASPNSDE